MASSVSNNQTGHLARINRQRDCQAKIDAETRIRVVLGQHDANLDEVMVAEPNSKAVRDWGKLLRTDLLMGEWTAVYQKAWEKCRRNGLLVWHERHDEVEEEGYLGDIQLTNLQSSDIEVGAGVGRAISDSTDFGDSDEEVECFHSEPAPHHNHLSADVRETPSISELVSILEVLTRTTDYQGMSDLRSEVLAQTLRALLGRL